MANGKNVFISASNFHFSQQLLFHLSIIVDDLHYSVISDYSTKCSSLTSVIFRVMVCVGFVASSQALHKGRTTAV